MKVHDTIPSFVSLVSAPNMFIIQSKWEDWLKKAAHSFSQEIQKRKQEPQNANHSQGLLVTLVHKHTKQQQAKP